MTRTVPVFTLPPGAGQAGLPVVQIGHMGPAAYPLGPVIGLVALGQALRRARAPRRPLAAVPFTHRLNPKLSPMQTNLAWNQACRSWAGSGGLPKSHAG
jgi:hypothetical protein